MASPKAFQSEIHLLTGGEYHIQNLFYLTASSLWSRCNRSGDFFLGSVVAGKAWRKNANPASIPVSVAKKTLLNVEFSLKKIIGNFQLIRHDVI